MDQTEFNKRQTLTQFMSVQFLKKVTQLLLSVSVFSFFFSYSSLISSPQSFNFYFSTFPSQLFSHTIDKNSIFLLCNGLLVFLAKYSGLTRSLSGSTYNDEYSFESEGNGLQPESSISESKKTIVLEKEVMVENIGTAGNVALEQERETKYLIKELEKETENSAAEEGGVGGENRFSNSKEEEVGIFFLENEEKQNETVTGSFIEEEEGEEEEEEEEGNGMLSTEELNKKFEDFIRRMKEEIRIEARQQLVMV